MNFELRNIFGSLLILSSSLLAQSSDSTQLEGTESTTYGDAMEIASTAVLIPLAVGSTVIGIVPPSGGAVFHDGKANGVISFQTGVGFGEKVDLKRFSDVRMLLDYTHIYGGNLKEFLRLETTGDLHLVYIDRRRIVLLGASPSLGIITDFPSVGYSAGVSTWLMTPWLTYFGFIPQHTFGITYRYNRYFGGKSFGELTAGISSAFTWGW